MQKIYLLPITRLIIKRGSCPLALFLGSVLGSISLAQPSITRVDIDRARYAPGQPVEFTLALQQPPAGAQARVKYWQQGAVAQTRDVAVTGSTVTWTWSPPENDFQGYLVQIELQTGDSVLDTETIGVDVSSDWNKFPRYGFLSTFSPMSPGTTNAIINNLNRHHINGIQFYDWHHEHHDPLLGTAEAPAASWPDIATRTNYLSTVEDYINAAHSRNMMAMSYNLAYGAWNSGPSDGVQQEWYLYKDRSHQQKDFHDLPSSWASDIFVLNAGNSAWQNYIAEKTIEAFEALPFDGWHIDQLGDRGAVYDYNGATVNIASTFRPFIAAMKANRQLANKRMIFNAVNQYGQSGIASSDVDFLYAEVWSPNENYDDLARIILTNNALTSGRLNTVLAAYINYDRANSPGVFNTPTVLLADAVIFAFGGAHIELGEHMLGKEYFPNSNLQMPPQLRNSVVNYYDFLVGYQNLLRDGGQFTDNPLISSNTSLNMWPAQQGSVSAVNKVVDGKEVFHLINFTDAVHMNWRDRNGQQPEPSQRSDVQLSFFSHKTIDRLWAASPDVEGGIPAELNFSQSQNGIVNFTLPSLKYWSLIVAEPRPYTGWDDSTDPAYVDTWVNGSNGGTGFGRWRLLATGTPGGFAGFWHPHDTTSTSEIDNAGAFDRDSGSAWSSFANKGTGVDKATAFRTFNTSLERAGDSFSVTLENAEVTGRVGLSLRSGNISSTPDDYAASARMQFYFQGGGANYTVFDGTGTLDTGVSWTPYGLKVEVLLTGSDTYDLLIWRFDQPSDLSPQVFSIQGRTLAGDGSIDSLAFFQYDAAGGAIQGDMYFNYLSYSIAATVPEPAALVLAMVVTFVILFNRRQHS
jgi:dextranase